MTLGTPFIAQFAHRCPPPSRVTPVRVGTQPKGRLCRPQVQRRNPAVKEISGGVARRTGRLTPAHITYNRWHLAAPGGSQSTLGDGVSTHLAPPYRRHVSADRRGRRSTVPPLRHSSRRRLVSLDRRLSGGGGLLLARRLSPVAPVGRAGAL